MKKDNKLFNLVDNILTFTNSYFKQFATPEGKINYSESSVSDLTKILGEIFKLNNYIVENNLYQDNVNIVECLDKIEEYNDKIVITESNAKSLDVKKAINYWENIHNYGFKMAWLIAEDKEYYKEEE